MAGAEEFGLVGAQAYVKTHSTWLHENQPGIYVLNLDGVGVNGRLLMVGGAGSKLGQMVKQACDRSGVQLGRLALPGELYDHTPFANAGIEAVTLAALGLGTTSVHTAQDEPVWLHAGGFDQAGKAVLGVMQILSSGRN